STARSGAILASPTVPPSWRSSLRTSAAAPRSEPGDPLRPRVGTRPAPRILPPDTSTTSVVAFPTSTPAITVTRWPPLRGPARPQRLVDGQHLVVGQPGQLGRAAQVLGQLRVVVLFGHDRLPLQGLRVNPEIGHADLPRPHRLHGQPVHRLPGQ